MGKPMLAIAMFILPNCGRRRRRRHHRHDDLLLHLHGLAGHHHLTHHLLLDHDRLAGHHHLTHHLLLDHDRLAGYLHLLHNLFERPRPASPPRRVLTVSFSTSTILSTGTSLTTSWVTTSVTGTSLITSWVHASAARSASAPIATAACFKSDLPHKVLPSSPYSRRQTSGPSKG